MQENVLMKSIRDEVKENLGKKVQVKADKGRKRIVVKKGVLENAFEDVFTVRVVNEFGLKRVISFTYKDILTSTVKLTIL